MKTSPRLVAALAAATLLLTACGSDDSADTSSAAPAPASSAASSPADEPSREESPSAEQSSSESTEDTSTEESTSDDSSSAASSEAGSTEPTRIIGGDTDTLDETSAAWFSAMCDGIVPLSDTGDLLQSSTTDPAAAAAAVEQMGTGLISTSETLADLPAPTFDSGDELATTVVAGLKAMGEKFQQAGTQLAANDPAALTTINEALETNPLAELQGAQMNPELQDDFRALPACAALNN